MSRRSIFDIVDRLGHDVDGDLERRADALGALGGPAPLPIHDKAVEVLTELLTLGGDLATDDTPLQLRVLMRTLTQVRPMIREMIAKVDPAQIVEFMGYLRDKIDDVIQEGPPRTLGADTAVVNGERVTPSRPVDPPAVDVPLPYDEGPGTAEEATNEHTDSGPDVDSPGPDQPSAQ